MKNLEVCGNDFLIRSLAREKEARKMAEQLLEQKSFELYEANQELERHKSLLENQLSTSELNFANIVESLPDLIVEIDDEGRLLFINNFGKHILLRDKRDIFGKPFLEFILESPTVEQLRTFLRKKKDYVEFNVVSSTGEIRPFGFNVVQKFRRNHDINTTTYMAVGRDLSVFRRLNRQIGWAKEFYKKALSSLGLMTLVVDRNFHFVSANEAFQEMFDTDSVGISNGLRSKLKQSQENNLLSSIKEIVLDKLEYKEERLVTTNGNIIWVHIAFFSVVALVSSSDYGYALVLRDITESKQLERQLLEARNEAIGALQAERNIVEMISHEMRTPLNVVLGLPPLIAKEENAQKRRSMTQNLHFAAKLLNRFVSSTLDLHMIASRNYMPLLNWLNYKDLIENICAVNKSTIPKKVTFNCLTKLDDKIEVELDGRLFASIILNLLNNAEKYTTNGSILITSTIISENQVSFLVLEVKDTGIGISQEELPHIFKKHYRSGSLGNSGVKGLGLGLTIVKEAVQLLNGSIEVESEVGVGTTFHLKLPIEYRMNPNSVPSQEDDFEQYADFELQHSELKDNSGKRVLLIEDDSLNADYFTRVLAEWKISVDWAKNEEEALFILDDAKSSYMAVFIDLDLENGVIALDLVGSLKERTENIPYFLITASRATFEDLGPMANHFKEIVYKPYTAVDLLKICKHNCMLETIEFELKNLSKFHFLGLPDIFDLSYINSFYKQNTHHFLINLRQVISEFDNWIDELFPIPCKKNRVQLISSLHRIIPNFKMIGLSDLSENCENYHLILQRIDLEALEKNVADQNLISTERNYLLNRISMVKELLREFALENKLFG